MNLKLNQEQIDSFTNFHKECDKMFYSFTLYKQAFTKAYGKCEQENRLPTTLLENINMQLVESPITIYLENFGTKPTSNLITEAIKDIVDKIWDKIMEVTKLFNMYHGNWEDYSIKNTYKLCKMIEYQFKDLLDEINNEIAKCLIEKGYINGVQ